MSYYIAKVKIRHEDENGKMKKSENLPDGVGM